MILSLFVLPICLIGAVVAFLALGITDLVIGLRRVNGKRNTTRIVRGSIFLGVVYLVIAAFIILLFYINLVPIAFM